MNLDSMREIIDASLSENKPIWELVIETDAENRGVTREDTIEKMTKAWQTMLDASENYDPERRSKSGLVGGQGERMRAYAEKGNTLAGDFIAEVMQEALAMGESNACMRRVVAAPTAGACGVMPAVLIPLYRRENIPTERMVEAMLVASGIGSVLAYRASISGAAGGCQAEIGSACSMAAAAVAQLYGLSIDQIEYAAEIAMEHNLGLTCDPVGGLVQIPCIERNAVAAMRALSSVNLSRFLYATRKISFDDVVATMYRTGLDLNEKYRETSHGGLAQIYREEIEHH